jgi:RHS repeat-associated protein
MLGLDGATQLDYFGARYLSSAMGRFASVDPSMESVVLRNPQSWNRYAYTINNPLRYIDPNGELWIASGDSADPYSWVDDCQKNRKCYQSRAAAVSGQLRVYGAKNAQDVKNYDPNSSGYIDLRTIASHPDAYFTVKPGANSFLSLKNAVGFFNTAEQYHEAYPRDAELFVTDAGRASGANFPPHTTHGQGRSVDIRYIGPNGEALQGPTAAEGADAGRIGTLVDIAEQNGFNQNYSARPQSFGTLYAPGHGSHLHIGTTKPVEQKIKPPNR